MRQLSRRARLLEDMLPKENAEQVIMLLIEHSDGTATFTDKKGTKKELNQFLYESGKDITLLLSTFETDVKPLYG